MKIIEHPKGFYRFICPACRAFHIINEQWTITGDPNSPSISPSIKVELPRTPDMNGPFDSDFPPEVCHLIIENGKINYLNDCTHDFVGQTINMINIEPPVY